MLDLKLRNLEFGNPTPELLRTCATNEGSQSTNTSSEMSSQPLTRPPESFGFEGTTSSPLMILSRLLPLSLTE